MAGSVKNCAYCGETYHRLRKYSEAQWARSNFCSRRCAAKRPTVLTPQEVLFLYIDGRSTTEIGRLLGRSSSNIADIIVEAGGSIRTMSEGKRLSHSRLEVREKISRAHTGRSCPTHVRAILRELVGPKNHSWKGGVTSNGRYLSYTRSVANGENAGKLVHRAVVEASLGRRLATDEHVHHRDRSTMNNNIENLEVLSAREHARLHAKETCFWKNRYAE